MTGRVLVRVVIVAVCASVLLGCSGRKVGKLSEADFIELNARVMALVSTERDPDALQTEMAAIFKKYDVTEEELMKMSEGLQGDTERMKRIGPKIMQRASELGAKK